MAAAAGSTRKYHVVMLGRTQFCVDTRFTNLRPIGEFAVLLISPGSSSPGSSPRGRPSCHARAPPIEALALCFTFPNHRRAWRLRPGRGG